MMMVKAVSIMTVIVPQKKGEEEGEESNGKGEEGEIKEEKGKKATENEKKENKIMGI